MNDSLIEIQEWQSIFLEGVELTDQNSREMAQLLSAKKIIEIEELKSGLSITSNSYVGNISIGELQIHVYPKLNGMPLYQLMRYTYGLRDLKIMSMTEHEIAEFSFFDLLIYELYVEAENLFRRNLQKSYVVQSEELASPKGRIDFNRLCSKGGIITEMLPCRYYNRIEDNLINQTLLAGLRLGAEIAADINLKMKLNRLMTILSENITRIQLNRMVFKQAINSLNRLTSRYTAVLEMINILYESQGIQLEDGSRTFSLKGYFFDMNVFFETLVGRLIADFGEEFTLKEQFSLHDLFRYTPNFNPNRRRSPTPRPDFALMREGKVVKLLDAKYRDLWEKSLPRDMLYQLAIYAVSGIGNGTATIIYPVITDQPTTQKIDINYPVSGVKMARVIMQPLNLVKVAELLKEDRGMKAYISRIIC
jgi:5-methylcytosine-specific restriction enzyme subunit McrC